MRKDLDIGEIHILKPVWDWHDAWMELRCKLVGLGGGEMLPGCRRYVNIRTQIEVRFKWDKEETWIWEPGWREDTNLETWMGLGWDLDWVEMHILRHGQGYMGLGWSWGIIRQLRKDLGGGETHLETCMGLGLCLGGTKMQFAGPGWRWDVTWVQVRCKYQDPDWSEIQVGQRRNVNRGAWVEMRHKSRDLDWVEMHILRRR